MNRFSNNQLGRYPIYLKYFKELLAEGCEFVSSPRIAAKLGYSEEQVRKDLQAVSLEAGRPKKGRSVKQLVEDLESFLGYHDAASAVLIGCGHLGGALLNFPAFSEMGLEILAGFDANPDLIGKTVEQIIILIFVVIRIGVRTVIYLRLFVLNLRKVEVSARTAKS